MIGIEEYENNTLEILKAFLMHGESQRKDKRKLDGYGLKIDDFLHKFKNKNNECHSSATKKMFVPRKNELLSNRYITPIRSKGKQTKYYSITPIGIAYLFQKFTPSSDLVIEFFNQIIKYLIFYHEATKPKLGYAKLLEDHHKIFQTTGNTKQDNQKEVNSLSLIFKTMNHIKISHYRYNETGVSLSYPLDFDTVVHYGEYLFTHKPISKTVKIMQGKKVNVFTINSKKITDEFLEIHLPSQKKDNKITTSEQFSNTTEKEIYQKISTFIIRAFFYQSILNKIKSYERKVSKIPSMGKSRQFKKEFRRIPDEYLWIMNDFQHELYDILMLNMVELDKIRDVYFDQLLVNT